MIVLPTKKRLVQKRNALYDHLYTVLHVASVGQVEDIMRRIHQINQRIKTYFDKENEKKNPAQD